MRLLAGDLDIELQTVRVPSRAMLLADAAGWITAMATSVAAVAAVVAGFFAFRAFGQQSGQLTIAQGQEEDRQADRRRLQAEYVSAWVRETTGYDNTPQTGVQVIVRNASHAPIWQCAVVVKGDWGPRPKARQVEWIDVLPPDESRVVEIDIVLTPGLPGLPVPPPPVELSFTDSAGHSWRRHDRGELEELGEERPPEASYGPDDED